MNEQLKYELEIMEGYDEDDDDGIWLVQGGR